MRQEINILDLKFLGFIDNVEDGEALEQREFEENAAEERRTTELMAQAVYYCGIDWQAKYSEMGIPNKRIILERAVKASNESGKETKKNEDVERERRIMFESSLYDFAAALPPKIIGGLTEKEILRQVNYLVKEHPKWLLEKNLL